MEDCNTGLGSVTFANSLCAAGHYLKQRAEVSWWTQGRFRGSQVFSLCCVFSFFFKSGYVCTHMHARVDKTMHYWSQVGKLILSQPSIRYECRAKGLDPFIPSVLPRPALLEQWVMVLSTPCAKGKLHFPGATGRGRGHSLVQGCVICKQHPSVTLSSGLCWKAQTSARLLCSVLSAFLSFFFLFPWFFFLSFFIT